MYSVVVAEDEQIERESLIALIEQEFSGSLTVDYAAVNGLFALKYLFSHKVDILFLDIRMPVMNGIDIMREIRKVKRNLEIIVVSAYSDFKYARQSLSFGVVDYLLKPYTLQDLHKALAKAFERLERREKSEQTMKVIEKQRERLREMIHRDVISSIFYSKSVPSEEEFDQLVRILELPSRNWKLAVFRFSDADPPPSQNEWEKLLNMYRSTRKECIVFGSGREMVALHFSRPDDLPHRQQSFLAHCRRFCESELGCLIFYYFSEECSGAAALLDTYNEGVVSLSAVASVNTPSRVTCLSVDFAGETAALLLRGDRGALEDYLNGISGRVKTLDHGVRVELLRDYLTLLQGELFRHLPRSAALAGDQLLTGIKEQLVHGDCNDLHRCFSGIGRLMEELSRQLGSSHEILVGRTREYIDAHLDEDLSVDGLAREVKVSSSHLSRVFRDMIGMTLNQYIIRIRLERGDELIRMEGLSIKETAARIGIRDPNYLTKLYKKYFGRAPTKAR